MTDQAPAAGTTTTEPAAPAAGDPTTTPGGQVPEFQDPRALQERLDRHGRKVLKDALGVSTPEEAKAIRDRLAAMEAAEEARKLEAMTEAQRLQAVADDSKAKLAAVQAELADERRNGRISAVLHEKGVRNVDYAKFLLERDRQAAGADGSDYDYGAALSKAMGDPLTRTALGIVDGDPQQPTTVTQPANTSPAAGGFNAPKPPTAGGTSEGPKSAKGMTDPEWQAYKRSQGMF